MATAFEVDSDTTSQRVVVWQIGAPLQLATPLNDQEMANATQSINCTLGRLPFDELDQRE